MRIVVIIGLIYTFVAFSVSSLAAATSLEYVFDDVGRLVRVVYDNGIVIEYSYDGAGNRTVYVITPSS